MTGPVDVFVMVDDFDHPLNLKPYLVSDLLAGVATVRSVVVMDRSTGLTATRRNDETPTTMGAEQ